jgi:Leucine-rich repeat (LRR) protein
MEATPGARLRWLRPTPDRLIVGLLIPEAFLLLSQWFDWLPKGWPVLIAIATVAVAMLLMVLWFLVALLSRWRFQYGIRSLLVLVVVVAIPCSWLSAERERVRKQRQAVEEIRKAGGMVAHSNIYQLDPSGNRILGAPPPGPAWLCELLGYDLFGNVTLVQLSNSQVSDATLKHLKALTQLQELDLIGTKISDAGLENLKGLTQLQELHLNGTNVTDAGLENLEGLTRLQLLDLSGTNVGDAGLKHLKGLTRLRQLILIGTRLSDAGLEHLKGLAQLQWLILSATKVSDAGVKELQRALPNTGVQR